MIMLKGLSFFSFFFYVFLLHGESQPRSLLNKVGTNAFFLAAGAIGSPLLNSRCSETLACTSAGNYLACHNSIAEFVTAAQFDKKTVLKAGFARDYLTDDRAEVENSERGQKCLDILNTRISTGESFNLWTATLTCFRGNKNEAIQFMATTFNEVTTSLLPQNTEFEKKKVNFIQSLIPLIRSGKIDGYPPGVNIRKSGLYHFYAMAQTALNMRSNGSSLGTSLAMPFVINESYEQARNRSSLKMPYQDIYSTYAGVQFALSDDKHRFTGRSYEEFQVAYHSRGRKVAGEYFKEKFGAESVCHPQDAVPLPPSVEPIEVDRQLLLEPHPLNTTN